MAEIIPKTGTTAQINETTGKLGEIFVDTDKKTVVVNDGETKGGFTVASAVFPGWTAPTLLNSWANYGGVHNTAGYYKDSFGIVHLRGLVKNGTVEASTPIFTLPEGYRPTAKYLLSVLSNYTIGRVNVFANGDVTAELPSNNTYVSLDGISFSTF